MSWKKVEIPLEFMGNGPEVVDLEVFDGNVEDMIVRGSSNEKYNSETKKKVNGKGEKRKKDNDDEIRKKMGKTGKPDKSSKGQLRKIQSKGKKKKRSTSDTDSDDDSGDDSGMDRLEQSKTKVIPKSQVCDINAETQVDENNQIILPGVTSKKLIKEKSVRKNAVDPKQAKKAQSELSKWKNFDLPVEILAALKEKSFKEPTEIQKQAIPAALQEYRDVIAAAETGSGKTLAFGLPLLTHVFNKLKQGVESEKRPLGLVLVPTRELAVQVKQHLDAASQYLEGVYTGLIVGGLSVAKQQRILNQKPPILVATPGRLWQMVRDKTPGLEDIASIRYLVVDEADRIVERAHFRDLKMLIQHIKDKQPERHKRQTLLFSATLTFAQYDVKNKVTDREVLQEKLQNLMEQLCMKNRPKIIDLSPKGTTTRSLVEAKVICNGGDVEKDAVLYAILSQYPGRTLVFANAINTVRKLANLLRLLFGDKSKPNYRPILLLHAQLRQRMRLKYLDRFRDDPNAIMIASDVAARGLDIPNIEHVVHYHVPNNTESYVHRSGRTARVAKEGLSILLVDPKVEAGRFWRLMANLCRKTDSAEVNEVVDFEIDDSLLKQCRQRTSICRELEALRHMEKKKQSEKKWLADQGSDFDSDSSSERKPHHGDDFSDEDDLEKFEAREMSAAAKQLEKQLKRLLHEPLKLKPEMKVSRYPSALGEAISLEDTEAVASGRLKVQASRAVDQVAKMKLSKKGVSMKRQVTLAGKIEKRKEKQASKVDKKREERLKKKQEKRDKKRQKRENENPMPEIPEGKEFVIY